MIEVVSCSRQGRLSLKGINFCMQGRMKGLGTLLPWMISLISAANCYCSRKDEGTGCLTSLEDAQILPLQLDYCLELFVWIGNFKNYQYQYLQEKSRVSDL
ncbi:unnamed protein product [Fraxinus pennsylvanica]|uniref:Uncharacterized protein n=1 Tax=Fraxinus pennsylvanica TaxID=56036 RepID=A0AAD1YMN3_9LAMI|nr:unnamed protein product [Fraxinus pennsylvanica]